MEIEQSFWDIVKNSLGAIGTVVTMVNPMAGAVIKITDAIVNSENESISNESVIKVLESMAKSKGNNLDMGQVEDFADTLSYLANKSK